MGWRISLGVLLFVLGWMTPLLIPLVMALDISTEIKVVVSAGLMVGVPELLWAVAIVILGKDGFLMIKERVFRIFKKYALPRKVGRVRYSIGLVMFVVPLLFGWIVMYVPQYFWGFVEHRIMYSLVGDLIFFTSFFVLGGEFWGKFKALFTYDAVVQPRK